MAEIGKILENNAEILDIAWLYYIRGLSVYVDRTYQDINPLLKGFKVTTNNWIPHQDKYCCNMRGKE